jgi:hypothetical protein
LINLEATLIKPEPMLINLEAILTNA